MLLLAFVLLAYLLGSISFAVLMARAFGLPDPRTFGSKNPGATNMLRTGKKKAAALTLLGDAAKGWLAVFIAQHWAPVPLDRPLLLGLVSVAAFLGHLYPVFFRFQGGKGVATALGILLALNLWLGLAVLATWLLIAVVLRISSMAALVAAVLAPVYAWWLLPGVALHLAVLFIALLLVVRHRGNIVKLLGGEEGRIGEKAGSQDAG